MRVFISYSRNDMNAAKHIAEILAVRGADVFIDYQSIVGGESFLARIGREIRECDQFVLLLSANSAASTYVNDEVQNARVKGKPILVLRLDDTPMPDSFFFLEARQHIIANELKSGENLRDAAVIKLCQSLNLQFDPLITPTPLLATSFADDVLSILPPPFEWCPIPSGQVTIKGKTYYVPGFEMAKYPITNAQFQVFVDADDGYCDPAWWSFSDDARGWRRENKQPRSPAFEGDDHPRTNVSWYEAISFCRWLAARLHIEMGRATIILPSETQWQWAAVGDTGWGYPWGPNFDPLRCNSSANLESRGTSPITTYEGKGDSLFGVVDMIGNVWEWCRNPWDDAGSTELRRGGRCVVRGGSWFDGVVGVLLHVTSRNYGYPGLGKSGCGFRIAKSYHF